MYIWKIENYLSLNLNERCCVYLQNNHYQEQIHNCKYFVTNFECGVEALLRKTVYLDIVRAFYLTETWSEIS